MTRASLEVTANALGRSERFCLDGFERVVIGRSRTVAMSMQWVGQHGQANDPAGGPYSREHAALTLLEGRWQLADLGSSGGTWMNGGKIQRCWLDSGDTFLMNGSHRFRFLLEPVNPRWEQHAAQLAASDDGDAAWLVFSDALQELGDPIGTQMAGAGADPLLPLGFLNRMRADGTVTLHCRFGFVQKLEVRNVGLAVDLKERIFDVVLAQPVVRLLRELVVHIGDFPRIPLEAIAAAISLAAPPSLRVVRFEGALERPPRHLFPASMRVEWTPTRADP